VDTISLVSTGKPRPLGGGLVKTSWFKHYAATELPQFERIVRAGTPPARRPSSAIAASARIGRSVAKTSICSTCCGSGWNTPSLKRAVREQYERLRPSVVMIEDKASGFSNFTGCGPKKRAGSRPSASDACVCAFLSAWAG